MLEFWFLASYTWYWMLVGEINLGSCKNDVKKTCVTLFRLGTV